MRKRCTHTQWYISTSNIIDTHPLFQCQIHCFTGPIFTFIFSWSISTLFTVITATIWLFAFSWTTTATCILCQSNAGFCILALFICVKHCQSALEKYFLDSSVWATLWLCSQWCVNMLYLKQTSACEILPLEILQLYCRGRSRGWGSHVWNTSTCKEVKKHDCCDHLTQT